MDDSRIDLYGVGLCFAMGEKEIMKSLLCLMFFFTAVVKVPMGPSKTYSFVSRVEAMNFCYLLTLSNGKQVYVPIMFTVITED